MIEDLRFGMIIEIYNINNISLLPHVDVAIRGNK